MTTPSGPDRGPTQHNHQTNQAYDGGTIYSTQGGRQEVNNITNNTTNHTTKAARSWAGWAVLVIVPLDVIYFFYGMTAYTGQPNNTGDLWRAVIFFLLLATTGTLIRSWLRRRL